MIPEQTFFPDPALDRAFGVVMALAQEVWVLRDRVAAMEAQLAERGVLQIEKLNEEPAGDERAKEREAFVSHLMQNLLGAQQDRQCIEFEIRADILPAYDILTSCTSMAAEILMEDGRLGVVAPGAIADLIVVEGDPLANVRILARDGATLPIIMKDGVVRKRLI